MVRRHALTMLFLGLLPGGAVAEEDGPRAAARAEAAAAWADLAPALARGGEAVRDALAAHVARWSTALVVEGGRVVPVSPHHLPEARRRLRELSEPGLPGVDAARFEGSARQALVEVGLGPLDDPDAVRAVDCSVWRALDAAAGPGGVLPRLDGLVDGDVALEVAVDAAVACRVTPPLDDLAEAIAALPDGGSDGWDAEVSRLLLARHDLDGDGVLGGDEVAGVSCEAWHAVDVGVRSVWGSGVYTVYGFAPELEWVGGALGVDRAARAVAADALSGCALGRAEVSSTPAGGSPAERIARLPEGGSRAWDEAVRQQLLQAYDADGSGAVDREAEVEAVPCEVWRAVDAGVREAWPNGLFLTYGFHGELVFIGDVLGLAQSVRDPAASALRACDVPGADRQVSWPDDPEHLVQALAALPEVGSGVWSEVARMLLVQAYDRDDSGDLDLTEEVRGVPCLVWSGLDRALRDAGRGGLVDHYGFEDDAGWVGGALGIERGLRAIALDAVRSCDTAAAPDGGEASPLIDLLAWDLDGSGAVDRAREVRAVPCHVWHELDALAGRVGLGVVERYGLQRGAVWAGDALGLSPRVRGVAGRAATACLNR